MAAFQADRFGVLLKQYRSAAGLTQEELAERARLSRLTVSALERGVRRLPYKDTVGQLADALLLPEHDRDRLEAAARRVGPGMGYHSPGSSAYFEGMCDPPRLIGRDPEFDLLQSHIRGTGPSLVAIAGEPGIGKSRLLREATRFAEHSGYRVIQGECQRFGSRETCAPFAQAMANHFRRLDPALHAALMQTYPGMGLLLPEMAPSHSDDLPSVSSDQKRRIIGDALADYLTSSDADGTGAPAGSLLVLDDLHWCRNETLALINSLARAAQCQSTEHGPLRILVGYRDSELKIGDSLSLTLGDLVSGDFATVLGLDPLAPQAASELLHDLLAGADATDANSILASAGGVPFFLVGYARRVRRHTGTGGADHVPSDVELSIRLRLAALSRQTRALLRDAERSQTMMCANVTPTTRIEGGGRH